MTSKWENDSMIQRLREYLKIPSVHPDIDYDECVEFIKNQATELELSVEVYEIVAKKPIVVVTWVGLQPELPSIMLNSHMDVVPVNEEQWTYPPFEAHITEDGWLYARGTQDMKGQGMAYFEAIRKLKDSGIKLKRTVHVTFVPDEEIGGDDGMRVFVKTEEFKKLNVGFELDEGGPSPIPNALHAFNGERTLRHIKITCKGTPGHGALASQMGTAGDKIVNMLNKFMQFREAEGKKFRSIYMLGDLITINLTKLEGGVQVNVMPDQLSAYFDVRIAPSVDHDEFEKMIETWCTEVGDGVTCEYVLYNPPVPNTNIDNLPFYDALVKATNDMGMELQCIVCPGTTDARYVRSENIPAISLTPFADTPTLLHANDERIHVDVYKTGVDLMEKIEQLARHVEKFVPIMVL